MKKLKKIAIAVQFFIMGIWNNVFASEYEPFQSIYAGPPTQEFNEEPVNSIQEFIEKIGLWNIIKFILIPVILIIGLIYSFKVHKKSNKTDKRVRNIIIMVLVGIAVVFIYML